MGRPPCCDKIGMKKGPWTPEEDILLVSYIQQNGPGNWRSVPTNTGLLRCSKSCRLRWTNYLRPGIRRGEFTNQEESMIIHLQALLGNRWAAIASYLPQRTDNDIKNYWNTHLRKKLNKISNNQTGQDHEQNSGRNGGLSSSSTGTTTISKGQWERRLQTDVDMARQALYEALSLDNTNPPASINGVPSSITNEDKTHIRSSSSISNGSSSFDNSNYVSNTENISKWLKSWRKTEDSSTKSRSSSESTTSTRRINHKSLSPEGLESLLSFDSSSSSPDDFVSHHQSESSNFFYHESKPNLETTTTHNNHQVPLSLLEKWLFDEGVNNVQDQETSAMNIDQVGLSLDYQTFATVADLF